MAEALYDLSEHLAWSPTSAPRGELVLVTDVAESSGSFLVQHFVALFLKAGVCACKRVVVCSCVSVSDSHWCMHVCMLVLVCAS